MATPKLLYIHPKEGATQVKQGFCWPAFFFGSLWAVARRAYPLFFVLLLVDTVVWFVTGYAQAQQSVGLVFLSVGVTLAYAVIRGKLGNRWVESFLLSRGYALRGEVRWSES